MRSLLFFFLFALKTVLGQNPDVDIKARLEAHKRNNPLVKNIIFFNQDRYFPGDTAYFRIITIADAETHLHEKTILNLDLLDKDGIPKLRQMIIAGKGGAANQLIIPTSIEPGIYRLLVYSESMTDAYGLSMDFEITGTTRIRKIQSASVEMMPEGGRLVAGVLNSLIVKVSGSLNQEARLMKSGIRQSDIALDKNGYGSILFVPQSAAPYSIEATFPEGNKEFALPPAVEGFSLRVYEGPKSLSVISLESSPGFSPPDNLILLILSNRELAHSQTLKFTDGKAQVLLGKDFL